MALAIISALSQRPIRSDVALTGEITLRGRVLPIGGLKEKVLAAHRAMLKKVIVPARNEKDLAELRKKVLRELQIIYVDSMDEVIKQALVPVEKIARKPLGKPKVARRAKRPADGVATANSISARSAGS